MNSEYQIAELNASLWETYSLGRFVSVSHLAELRDDITGKYNSGLLDKRIYNIYMESFDYGIPDELPEAGAVIVIAMPQPHARLTFHINGKPRSFIVPTNYAHGTDDIVTDTLAGLFEREGFKIIRAQLPLKLLAARSGLASYGRNNITYVDGMGSFFRLIAFFTDFPFEEDNWGEIKMAERCKNCSACITKCPTGAIDPNRFLIRAEQCLTFFNESEDDIPSRIDPSTHHCLIGCLYCQKCCPLNQEFKGCIESSSVFSKDETDRILSGGSNDSLTPEIREKLDMPGLHYDIKIVARNLRLLMANNT